MLRARRFEQNGKWWMMVVMMMTMMWLLIFKMAMRQK
jgi:hypothetical protein